MQITMISLWMILKTANADILMGHLEINGFAMNAGHMVCEGGWDKTRIQEIRNCL